MVKLSRLVQSWAWVDPLTTVVDGMAAKFMKDLKALDWRPDFNVGLISERIENKEKWGNKMPLEVIMPKAGVDSDRKGQTFSGIRKSANLCYCSSLEIHDRQSAWSWRKKISWKGMEKLFPTEVIGYLWWRRENIPTAGAATPEASPAPAAAVSQTMTIRVMTLMIS